MSNPKKRFSTLRSRRSAVTTCEAVCASLCAFPGSHSGLGDKGSQSSSCSVKERPRFGFIVCLFVHFLRYVVRKRAREEEPRGGRQRPGSPILPSAARDRPGAGPSPGERVRRPAGRPSAVTQTMLPATVWPMSLRLPADKGTVVWIVFHTREKNIQTP